METIRTRFAPSPTGLLHLGHALAAKVAHDLARSSPGGVFLLRHEDIDGERVREHFYQAIEEDLRWLGLDWDGVAVRQTDRAGAHAVALEKLRAAGLLYPCFCTRREIREEIERMGGAPHAGEAPPYPGTCRSLSHATRDERIAAGVSHAWRLDSAALAAKTGPLTFTDLRFGKIEVDPNLLGDVVLARKDIGVAYHLAVVVDDAWQGITHVTRGEDLLSSTHVHRLLQAWFGLPEPVYHHHHLVTDAEGKRLAKRDESLTLRHLRESGATPAQVFAMMGSEPSDGADGARRDAC
jgi:glutamyl-Q tRNA(Asp) synthetase